MSLTWHLSLQAGRKEPSEALDRAIENMCKKTRELRRQVSEQTSLQIISHHLPYDLATQSWVGFVYKNSIMTLTQTIILIMVTLQNNLIADCITIIIENVILHCIKLLVK